MNQQYSFPEIRYLKKALLNCLGLVILVLFFSSFLQAQDPFTHLVGTKARGGAIFSHIHLDTCYAKNENLPSSQKVPRSNAHFWRFKERAHPSHKHDIPVLHRDNFNAVKTATFIIDFGPGFASLGENEQAARDAFRFAADIWETEVVSSVPILIAADFVNLPGGVIGSNGSPFVSNVPNAPDPEVVYTLALANAIAGFDLAPGTPNGNQSYNLNFNFYFGTDGNVPAGAIDFVTVVLHEIGHSMGMAGFGNGGAGVGANGGINPGIYDLFVERGDGTPLLDLGFGSPEQIAALVSGDLFMNAPSAVEALGGTRPQLYAPNPFQSGSSYSHWDEATFPGGDPNALMTPQLATQESNFDIGNIFRGLLSDQGWQLSNEIPRFDLGITQVIRPQSDSDLGESEQIKVLVRNNGLNGVESFAIAYQINEAPIIMETVSDSLPALSTLEYTFSIPADLSQEATSYNLSVFTLLDNDENTDNDSLRIEIRNLVPDISLQSTDLDFAQVGIGNILNKSISILNPARGDFAGELDILEVQGIGAPFSVNEALLPFTILAGDSLDLEFSFSPQEEGAFQQELLLKTNAGAVTLTLLGEGSPPAIIAVQPDTIFSKLNIGQSATQTLEIANQGQSLLEVNLRLRRKANSNLNSSPSQVAAPARLSRFNTKNEQVSQLSFRASKPNTGEVEIKNEVIADEAIYRIDDGSSENGLGFNADFEIMWLNAFQTIAGAEVITSISSALANGPASGYPARFLLYDDPNDDGNPEDAVFLTEVSSLLLNPNNDQFSTAFVTPTLVKGVFFVAVLVQENAGDRAFPAPLDDSSISQGASWVIGNEGLGAFDKDRLSNNSFAPILLDDAGFPGNWLLRADGLFFGVRPLNTTVNPGDAIPLEVEIFGNTPGSQEGEILIASNDPNRPEVIVPVNLQVGNVNLDVQVAPLALADTLEQGQSSQTFFTIQNNGNTPISYEINIRETQQENAIVLSNSIENRDPRTKAIQRPMPFNSPLGGRIELEKINQSSTLLETGFEAPAYIPGDINGQQTWFGQFGDWEINSTNPAGGAQHISSSSDSSGVQSICISPNAGLGIEAFSIMEMDVHLDGGGTTWEIIPQSPEAGFVITRLRFEPGNTVSVLESDGRGGSSFTPLAIEIPGAYFKVRIEVERATAMFKIFFDDLMIFEALGFTGNIEELVLLTNNEGASVFNVDNLRIIDSAGDLFVSANPLGGEVPVGGMAQIEVFFDADRPIGSYKGAIEVKVDNGQDSTNFEVEAGLLVIPLDTVLDVIVNPLALVDTLQTGGNSQKSFLIINNGAKAVDYNLNIVEQSEEFNRTQVEINDPRAKALYRPDIFQEIELFNQAVTVAYQTGFEAPDFILGDVNGQAGWFAQFFDWEVLNDNPGQGLQHLQSSADSSAVLSFSLSPEFGIGAEAFSSLTLQMQVRGNGTTWDIIPQSPSAGLVLTRFRIDTDNSLSALVSDGIGNGEYVPIASSLPQGYFNLKIEVERASNQFKIYIDEEEIFRGLGFVGGIEQLAVLTFNESTGILDVDEVQIIDGQVDPAPLFVSALPLSGQILPGDSARVDVFFDANRPLGFYQADIQVNLSHGQNDIQEVVAASLLVREEVDSLGPKIRVSPQLLQATLNQEDQAEQVLMIENIGDQELRFEIDLTGVEGSNLQKGKAWMAHQKQGESKQGKQGLFFTYDLHSFEMKIRRDMPQGIQYGETIRSSDLQTGDILLEAYFEGESFPPNGWRVVDNAGNGVNWVASSSMGYPNFAGQGEAAMVDSDRFKMMDFDSELRSPRIPIEGQKGLMLQFLANYQNFSGQDFLQVDISTDGGNAWLNVLTWNEDHGLFLTSPGEQVNLPLDDFVGDASELMIRWRYYNPGQDDWNWYVQIDDVRLISHSNVWLSVQPSSGILGPGEKAEIGLNFNASGIDPGFYVGGILVSSNDPDNPLEAAVATLEVLPVETQSASAGEEAHLVLYPNPSAEHIKIEFAEKVASGQIALIGSDGLIRKREFADTENLLLDVRQLPLGVYTIRIQIDGELVTRRFIKR